MSKEYNAYTLGDIIRLKGGFMVRNREPEVEEKVKGQLEYLHKLATTKPEIYGMRYLKHFCYHENKDTPILETKDLNKAIFEFEQRLKPTSVDIEQVYTKLEEATSGIKTQLFEQEKLTLENAVKELDKAIEINGQKQAKAKQKVLTLERNMFTYVRELDEKQVRLDNIKKDINLGEPGIINEIKKIINEGTWRFYKFFEDEFFFYSSKDVILRYSNPAANINRAINMGKFKLTIDLNGGFYVFPLYGNRFREEDYEGHYHPHVSDSGELCWGNKFDEIKDNRVRGEVYNNVMLLNQLLAVYHPGGPYWKFESAEKKEQYYTLDFVLDENLPKEDIKAIIGDDRDLIDFELSGLKHIEPPVGLHMTGALKGDLLLSVGKLFVVTNPVDETHCDVKLISEIKDEERKGVRTPDYKFPDLDENHLQILIEKGYINEDDIRRYKEGRDQLQELFRKGDDIPF